MTGRWSDLLARLGPGRTADGSSTFLEGDEVTGFAHRGDRARQPPGNHRSAFDAALEAGIGHIESDVHLTIDGELVLFHDDMLDEHTTGSGPIAARTWPELQRLRYRVGDDALDDGLVRLGDALERWPGIRWNIDAKHAEAVEPLLTLIAGTGSAHRLLVTSFSWRTIRRVRELAPPSLSTGVSGPEVALIKAASACGLPAPTFGDAVQVPVEHRGVTIVDERFLRTCRDAGMAVHVWTINERTEMRRLLELGVDGIMSDDPALLRSTIDAHTASRTDDQETQR